MSKGESDTLSPLNASSSKSDSAQASKACFPLTVRPVGLTKPQADKMRVCFEHLDNIEECVANIESALEWQDDRVIATHNTITANL